jgi:hypothetical protein
VYPVSRYFSFKKMASKYSSKAHSFIQPYFFCLALVDLKIFPFASYFRRKLHRADGTKAVKAMKALRVQEFDEKARGTVFYNLFFNSMFIIICHPLDFEN